jgi:HPt (histidine-containing phosphotransfer) domain-containing protein
MSKPVEPARLLDAIAKLGEGQCIATRAPEPATGVPRPAALVLNPETIALVAELGNSEFLQRLIDVFMEDTATLLDQLDVAVRAGRAEDARLDLHAIKGSAASLGTDRLASACDELRVMEEGEMRFRGAVALRVLRGEFEAACRALAAFLQTRESSSG